MHITLLSLVIYKNIWSALQWALKKQKALNIAECYLFTVILLFSNQIYLYVNMLGTEIEYGGLAIIVRNINLALLTLIVSFWLDKAHSNLAMPQIHLTCWTRFAFAEPAQNSPVLFNKICTESLLRDNRSKPQVTQPGHAQRREPCPPAAPRTKVLCSIPQYKSKMSRHNPNLNTRTLLEVKGPLTRKIGVNTPLL